MLLVGVIVVLAWQLTEPPKPRDRKPFDVAGAVGLFFVVFGVLQTGTYGWFVSRAAFAVGGVVRPAGGVSPLWLFATIGILASSAVAGRPARRHSRRRLGRAGFVVTLAGLALVLLLVRAGSGVGVMLTAPVDLVQPRRPDAAQCGISGVSRSVSHLGSSVGTAPALAAVGVAAVAGLIAAVLLPASD